MAGLGVAGLAAARVLCERHGASEVRAWGETLADRFRGGFEELRELGMDLSVGDVGDALLEGRRCLVKSPGIPDDAPVLSAALAAGAVTIDEAELGWRLDGRPLVGVTGTNGKSTVCALIAAALDRGDVGVSLAGNREGGPALSTLAGGPGDVVVGELSSFQLRHSPTLLPDVGVLTNCTRDSWHRHGGRAGYERDKARIVLTRTGDLAAPHAVLPADDALGRRLASAVRAVGGTVLTFGFARDADYRIRRSDWDLDRSTIEIDTPEGALVLTSRLVGDHNALNAAAALAAAAACGVGSDVSVPALETTQRVPGRLERIDDRGGDLDVLVDYAHNPAGIERTLATARRVVERRGRGRVVVVASALPVFDDAQYAAMATALATADRVIATTERLSAAAPLAEPPAFHAALETVAPGSPFEVDRRRAIDRAVTEAYPGDVVLVLGRGRRRTPIYVPGEGALTVDDRECARAALARVGG